MISLSDWSALDDAARRVWLDGLLERLPEWFALVDASGAFARFEDTRYAHPFVLVPSAKVIIGVTSERAEAAYAALERSPMQVFMPYFAMPAREVLVPAHFAATRTVLFEREHWVPRMSIPRALTELNQRGWRLPSEAEWEVQFRLVNPQLPLVSTGEGELCLDDWHERYDTLVDASPRGRGAELVRVASVQPDDLASIIPARLPLRSAGGARLRPVAEIP